MRKRTPNTKLLEELEKNNFPQICPSAFSVRFSFLGLLRTEIIKLKHGWKEFRVMKIRGIR